MKHSPTTVSDLSNTVIAIAEEIDNIILIGEKIPAIQEAAELYNELQTLVTADYFTDIEFAVMKRIGISWHKELRQYTKTLGEQNGIKEEHYENLEELEDQIRDALKDLFEKGNNNGRDNGNWEHPEWDN
tara:strand:- start:455 stop:844 length:390 start_codon:yes stop_codon:yes gene_type:complete